jgi:hypothetical protein
MIEDQKKRAEAQLSRFEELTKKSDMAYWESCFGEVTTSFKLLEVKFSVLRKEVEACLGKYNQFVLQ